MSEDVLRVGASTASDGALASTTKAAAISGGIGFLIGGTTGIIKNTTPIIYGIASSAKCATLGSTFWATRHLALSTWHDSTATKSDLTKASGLAGAVAGGLGGFLLRGPRNVLPGMICMAALGAGGQAIVSLSDKQSSGEVSKPKIWSSLSVWSPVQSFSNEEYAKLLKEKLLRVEVEIAVLDDKIAALKAEEGHTGDEATDG